MAAAGASPASAASMVLVPGFDYGGEAQEVIKYMLRAASPERYRGGLSSNGKLAPGALPGMQMRGGGVGRCTGIAAGIPGHATSAGGPSLAGGLPLRASEVRGGSCGQVGCESLHSATVPIRQTGEGRQRR